MIGRRFVSAFLGLAFAVAWTAIAWAGEVPPFNPAPVAGGQYYPLAPYVGQVATHTQSPSLSTTSNKAFMSRSRHYVRDTVTAVQIAIPNWYIASAVETAGPGSAEIKGSIEYPAGVCTPVTFGGASRGVLAAGTALVSDFARIYIPNGAPIFVRIFWESPSGGIVWTPNKMDTANGEGMEIGAVGAVADKTTSCASVSVSNAAVGFTPLGIYAVTTKPSVLIIGDSKFFGGGVTDGDAIGLDASTNTGTIERAVGPLMGYSNVSLSGDRAQWFAASHSMRLSLARYYSHAIVGFGMNDFAAGRSPTEVAADMATIRAALPSGMRVFQSTITAKTTSSDLYVTTANQTVTANEANRLTINTGRRAGTAGYAGTIDLSPVLETGGKWIVNGVAKYATPDGTHETFAANELVRTSGIMPLSLFAR